MHTDVLNTDPDSCPPEVKQRPMKTIHSNDGITYIFGEIPVLYMQFSVQNPEDHNSEHLSALFVGCCLATKSLTLNNMKQNGWRWIVGVALGS